MTITFSWLYKPFLMLVRWIMPDISCSFPLTGCCTLPFPLLDLVDTCVNCAVAGVKRPHQLQQLLFSYIACLSFNMKLIWTENVNLICIDFTLLNDYFATNRGAGINESGLPVQLDITRVTNNWHVIRTHWHANINADKPHALLLNNKGSFELDGNLGSCHVRCREIRRSNLVAGADIITRKGEHTVWSFVFGVCVAHYRPSQLELQKLSYIVVRIF